MAVAVVSAPVSMTAEQYDRVIKQLDAAGAGDPRDAGCTPVSVKVIT